MTNYQQHHLENFSFLSPNYKLIINHRIFILKKLQSNKNLLQQYLKHYSTNPIDFIQDWGMTYDPRNAFDKTKTPHMPFVLFDKQKEYVNWLYESLILNKDGMVEKTRDAGITWVSVAFSSWAFLFVSGSSIGWGSRKASLVDTLGDMDSIFEKIRYFIKALPSFFYPIFTDEKGLTRQFSPIKDINRMKCLNGKDGASITGEAGEEIGRGGRKLMYFVDEAASLENPESTDAALSQNTNIRIEISSSKGQNYFYKKRSKKGARVMTFRWTDDPRKDDEWYKEQCEKLDPVIVAQEIDINYKASDKNVCIPFEWVSAAINFKPNARGVKTLGYDVADDGADANAIALLQGISIVDIKEWDYDETQGDTTVNTRKVFNYCKLNNIEYINFDAIGVGAGARGEFNSLLANEKVYKPTIVGVKVSEAPSKGQFDNTDYDNQDMLLNKRAELWWGARQRFRKTYEQVKGINSYDEDELISIPDDTKLIEELTSPRIDFKSSGKIAIESKDAMRKRGISSPNKADAVLLCFSKKETFSLGMF